MICFEVRATCSTSSSSPQWRIQRELDLTRSLFYTFSQEWTGPASSLTWCRNTLQFTNPRARIEASTSTTLLNNNKKCELS